MAGGGRPAARDDRNATTIISLDPARRRVRPLARADATWHQQWYQIGNFTVAPGDQVYCVVRALSPTEASFYMANLTRQEATRPFG